MPRPATVTALLRIVEEQSATIRMLTEQLRATNSVSVTPNGAFVPQMGASVPHVARTESQSAVSASLPERVHDMVRMRSYGDPALQEYLEELAASLLGEGMEEVQVIQTIAQGEQ